MMITTKFKELMSLNGEMNAAEIESRFTQIAKLLFENFAIQKGRKNLSFKEIEFTSTISIIVTLSLIPCFSDSLYWYVNDFGGIDLNFPSEIW